MSEIRRRWRAALTERLASAGAQGVRRSSRSSDRSGCIDLASNDYLRLRHHQAMAQAVRDAAERDGTGSGASRLAGGSTALHEAVEARLASFKRAETATLLPTGYMANLAVLTAFPGAGDLILLDRRSHASLIDAVMLAGARSRLSAPAHRTFRHNDVESAHAAARKHRARAPDATIWIVVESVYSMDGDVAPIAALAALRDALASESAGGACLLIDEAHATGVLGPSGAGLAAAHPGACDIAISTASKALGAQGGFVTGPLIVKEILNNFARQHIYTTAIAPPIAAAVAAAVDIIEREPDRRVRLSSVSMRVRSALRDKGWVIPAHDEAPTPIIPLIAGENDAAVTLSRRLRDAGVVAPAIRPPSTPVGMARVRLSLHCELSDDDVSRIVEAVGSPSP